MTDNSDFESQYKKNMSAVSQLLTDQQLDHMRSSAIGGASVSTAIVLLLLQTGANSCALRLALYSSILAIPVWVTAWQYVQAYIFYGKASHSHFNSLKGSGVAVLLAVTGMIFLFTSLVALIWHLAHLASFVFCIVSLLFAVLVVRHNNAVKKSAELVEPANTD